MHKSMQHECISSVFKKTQYESYVMEIESYVTISYTVAFKHD